MRKSTLVFGGYFGLLFRDKHIMLIFWPIMPFSSAIYFLNPIMLLCQLLLCLHCAQKIYFTYKKNDSQD